MAGRKTARQLEEAAARGRSRPSLEAGPLDRATGEVLRMLGRRGFRPSRARLDVPFPTPPEPELARSLRRLLGHYGFRLFLRGAILHGGAFSAEQATRYLAADRAREYADALVELGLAARQPGTRELRLVHPAQSFGGTLEWFVAHELRERLALDVEVGLKFHAKGLGGDLDVVAAAEGKLVYLELKSSPPKHLSDSEVVTFLERVRMLRPDVAVFALDTALRLADKVVPMFEARLDVTPHRVFREVWALSPHLYLANAREDLLANLERAISEGFRARGPDVPPPRRGRSSA